MKSGKYIILKYFWGAESAYFLDTGQPVPTDEPTYPDAYQEEVFSRYSMKVSLVPRISFVQRGNYYQRVIDTVYEYSFEDWEKRFEGCHCFWEQLDESTRLYVADTLIKVWLIDLSVEDYFEETRIVPLSGYFTKDGQELPAIVVGKARSWG